MLMLLTDEEFEDARRRGFQRRPADGHPHKEVREEICRAQVVKLLSVLVGRAVSEERKDVAGWLELVIIE